MQDAPYVFAVLQNEWLIKAVLCVDRRELCWRGLSNVATVSLYVARIACELASIQPRLRALGTILS